MPKEGSPRIAWDLFSGRGGWARGLRAAGFKVVALDIEPQPENPADVFLQLDVRKATAAQLVAAGGGLPSVVTGSPPCVGLTRLRHLNPELRDVRPRPLDLLLVLECVRVMHEASELRGDDELLWCIENVDGARPFFQTILGDARKIARPFWLWGRFPDFELPPGPVKVKMGAMGISSNGRPRARSRVASAKSAEIPGELAEPFARACMAVVA